MHPFRIKVYDLYYKFAKLLRLKVLLQPNNKEAKLASVGLNPTQLGQAAQRQPESIKRYGKYHEEKASDSSGGANSRGQNWPVRAAGQIL